MLLFFTFDFLSLSPTIYYFIYLGNERFTILGGNNFHNRIFLSFQMGALIGFILASFRRGASKKTLTVFFLLKNIFHKRKTDKWFLWLYFLCQQWVYNVIIKWTIINKMKVFMVGRSGEKYSLYTKAHDLFFMELARFFLFNFFPFSWCHIAFWHFH